jgi:hypothetical protein
VQAHAGAHAGARDGAGPMPRGGRVRGAAGRRGVSGCGLWPHAADRATCRTRGGRCHEGNRIGSAARHRVELEPDDVAPATARALGAVRVTHRGVHKHPAVVRLTESAQQRPFA